MCAICFQILHRLPRAVFFFFNDTATTEIYTLSLHDALPISSLDAFGHELGRRDLALLEVPIGGAFFHGAETAHPADQDRKSTRLNSSHSQISYAVFCLKKKRTSISLSAVHEFLYRHRQSSCM